jgi:hypothetical protein
MAKRKTQKSLVSYALTPAQQAKVEAHYKDSYFKAALKVVEEIATDEADKMVDSPKFRASLRAKMRDALSEKLDELVYDAISDVRIELG